MNQEISISRRLAPEDIVPGAFIALSAKVHEIFPIWLVGCVPGAPLEMIRVRCLACAEGLPRRVISVCLPFVMTEDSKGRVEVLDTRQDILVQVDEMFGLEVFTRPEAKRCQCGDY